MKEAVISLKKPFNTADYIEFIQLIDALLEKHGEQIELLKHKAYFILAANQQKYSLQEAEQCLLKAHDLVPENLDILNELVTFYGLTFKDSEKEDYFHRLFCELLDRKTKCLY
jgi:antitoxin component HigA of HigAB toxin-antitoxin module